MTDRKRRDLASRYAAGTMPPGERNAFEQQLAQDRRLRAFVDAERLIAHTLQPAAGAVAMEHAATRTVVMERLAGLPHAAGPGAGAAVAGGASLVVKIVAVAAIGLGTLAGGYFALRNSDTHVRTERAPSTAPASTAPASTAPAPTAPASTVHTEPAVTDTQPTTPTPVVQTQPEAVPAAGAPSAEAPARGHTARREATSENPRAKSGSGAMHTEAPSAADVPIANGRPRNNPVVVKRNDQFRFKVSVPPGSVPPKQ